MKSRGMRRPLDLATRPGPPAFGELGHRRWQLFGILLSHLCACSTPSAVPPPTHPSPLSVKAAEAERASQTAGAPTSFKMLHQVVAKYQGQSYLMSGYLLGRKDGSFRVSASAPIGPKLFDVAKVNGRWESHVYLKPLAERLDATNVGRSVERIYFLSAKGPLKLDSGLLVSRSTVHGEDEIDAVEDWLDAETLALRRRRFFKSGTQVVQVDYDKLELVQGVWLARNVQLADGRGFSLELSVTEYVPGFPAPDSVLNLQVDNQ